MSGNNNSKALEGDRRVRRTRNALVQAFMKLVLERNYDDIRVGDIIECADVGRSTFYEHFKNKDDLLLKSLTGLFSALANATKQESDLAHLQFVVEHFWENRRLARGVLFGSPGDYVRKLLVREIGKELVQNSEWKEGTLSTDLVAVQIAGSQLDLIKAWLLGEVPARASTITQTIDAGSKGLIRSMTR